MALKNWTDFYLNRNNLGIEVLNGYYNHNYVINFQNEKYILRVPLKNVDNMDLKLIPESKVLKFLETVSFDAPRLVFEAKNKSFYIHSYIGGELFNKVYPASNVFPDWIVPKIVDQIKQLHGFKTELFVKYSKIFANSPNTSLFFETMISQVEEIYNFYKKEFSFCFEKLRIPNDPFSSTKDNINKLTERSFKLSHCDVHRKNIIITKEKGLVFLDWELVLITDPAYDIAVHFHKMRYQPYQEIMFLECYLDCKKNSPLFINYWGQIQTYLELERVKSAIVDFIRYFKDFKQITSKKLKFFYAKHYQKKLNKARKVWGINLRKILSIKEIYSLLESTINFF